MIIRKYVGSFLFHVFNWTFISFIQSILLFLLAAPVYPILLSTQFEPEIQGSDLAFVALDVGLVIFEVFADQQQWGKSPIEPAICRYRHILTWMYSRLPKCKESIPTDRKGSPRV